MSSPSSAPIGVLLVQLGTPDAPTPSALRRYLGEFLSDRRVVDLSPVLWKPILHGVVLRTRPRKSAALYQRIWTEAGSPLLVHSRAQAEGLAGRLGSGFQVELGMRYGSPSVASALDRITAAGIERVLVLPLFPQYCSATTGSVLDAVGAWAKRNRRVPQLSFVRSFCDHPAWIDAIAAVARERGAQASAEAPLVVSFHGVPRKLADEGDPYPEECARTARAVAAALGLADDAWRLAWQSRFGRARWLEPALDATLRELAASGVRRVTTITPSFVADCLETIDEVGRESGRAFREAGGADYAFVPCPNARPEAIEALARIVEEHVPPAWGR